MMAVPIRLIVPLVPGSNQDSVARAVVEELSKGLPAGSGGEPPRK
jgi:tripartite-type tricarboxylate transporter receptor subunit TctC